MRAFLRFCRSCVSCDAGRRPAEAPSRLGSQLTQLLQRAGIGLLIALAAIASPATAKRIYQYRDANGILHFTDQKPADDNSGVKETVVKAEHQPLVDMRTSAAGNMRRFSFFNRLAGPVELELSLGDVVNISSEPPMPVRVVLPAQRETPVATVGPGDPHRNASYSIGYRAVPGDPNARPDETFVYQVPFPYGSPYELHQGFGGTFSHTDAQSRYAVDLAVTEGTTVSAARAGIVMQVEEDYHGAGIDRERFAGRANHVRVLHDDGSMAVYAHLKLESVIIAVGQHLRQGQKIGESGNTGFSTGPHLHFAVQVNKGMDIESIPFRFEGLEIPEG